jgi:GT2 family glycosyltransferase
VWESGRPVWFPEELDWIVGCSYTGLPKSKAYVRNPIGCNMSFRKDVFEKVGYFKTNIGRVGKKLIASEETEFSIRVLEKLPESKVVYDPSAVVYHKVPSSRASVKYVARRAFAEGVSKAIFSNQKPNPTNVLHVEKDYLRRMFSTSTPRRLIRGYKPENISQIITLSISTILVLFGYLLGKHS